MAQFGQKDEQNKQQSPNKGNFSSEKDTNISGLEAGSSGGMRNKNEEDSSPRSRIPQEEEADNEEESEDVPSSSQSNAGGKV